MVAPRAQHHREGTHPFLIFGDNQGLGTLPPPLRQLHPCGGQCLRGGWIVLAHGYSQVRSGVQRRGKGAPQGLTQRTWGWLWKREINWAETSSSTNKAQPCGDA